ncbi:TetR/AcrR family transcriptional regulator [Ramlibacter sp. PS4R-6]|uniref:TetR/AcrR family transcriptional regulator n=1 Tax=Ramlibacter sp. PS4R-6 TaxID=3133438 RepID=UPI0030A6EE40
MHDPVTPLPARRGPAPTKHLDILWAAAQLFSRRGVAGSTTREIAAAANTTERTLFKHFGSKEGLVHAVIAEAVVAHIAPTSLEALRRAIEASADDLEGWHAELLKARSASLEENVEFTRLLLVELLRDEQLREQFAKEWLAAVWEPLLALFRKLQREGRLRRDIGAEALVRMFLSLNVGHLVARHILAPDAQWDGAKDLAAVASFFARGAAPG